MAGAPSHIDTVDYGKPASSPANQRRYLKSQFKFSQHDQNRLWLPETLLNLTRHAHQLCVLNCMHTDLPAHAQAMVEISPATFASSAPAWAAWMLPTWTCLTWSGSQPLLEGAPATTRLSCQCRTARYPWRRLVNSSQ